MSGARSGAKSGRRPTPQQRGPKPQTKRSPVAVPDTHQGGAIIWSAWIGTGVFVVGSLAAALVKDARLPAAIVDLVLFFGGCGVFLWALAAAAGRSREHEIALWNLFLLEGAAPTRVRRALLGALALEVAVALGTAWITVALAFGCLVPLWALGHSGLWGARFGVFGPRSAPPARRRSGAKG